MIGKRRQTGFALILALWFMAILIVAVGYLAAWTERVVATAQAEQNRADARLAMASTEASVRYLLATRTQSVAGLRRQRHGADDGEASIVGNIRAVTGNEIALDGRSYQGLSGAGFALQDEGGLIGLNRLEGGGIERLLGHLGIGLEQRSAMVAALRDYTDPDDLRRLNGAEAGDYRGAGLPPPANQRLRTVHEARRILGWHDADRLWGREGLPRYATVLQRGGANLNTSPRRVLQAQRGIDREMAQAIVATRPHGGLAQASSQIGEPIPLPQIGTAILATKTLKLTVFHPEHPRQHEIHLELTPTRPNAAPWSNHYALEVPRQRDPSRARALAGALVPTQDMARP